MSHSKFEVGLLIFVAVTCLLCSIVCLFKFISAQYTRNMHFMVYELGLNASWKVLRVSPPAGVLVVYWTLRGEMKSRRIDRVERAAIRLVTENFVMV